MRKGDPIELCVHGLFQCLLGASSMINGPVSCPLSEVPSPQSGSVPRKFGTFFFNQWRNWAGVERVEWRRGTDTDKRERQDR